MNTESWNGKWEKKTSLSTWRLKASHNSHNVSMVLIMFVHSRVEETTNLNDFSPQITELTNARHNFGTQMNLAPETMALTVPT